MISTATLAASPPQISAGSAADDDRGASLAGIRDVRGVGVAVGHRGRVAPEQQHDRGEGVPSGTRSPCDVAALQRLPSISSAIVSPCRWCAAAERTGPGDFASPRLATDSSCGDRHLALPGFPDAFGRAPSDRSSAPARWPQGKWTRAYRAPCDLPSVHCP